MLRSECLVNMPGMLCVRAACTHYRQGSLLQRGRAPKLLGPQMAQTGEAAARCSAMASWAASQAGWACWAA